MQVLEGVAVGGDFNLKEHTFYISREERFFNMCERSALLTRALYGNAFRHGWFLGVRASVKNPNFKPSRATEPFY